MSEVEGPSNDNTLKVITQLYDFKTKIGSPNSYKILKEYVIKANYDINE